MVVTGPGNDVEEIIIRIDDLKSLLHHIYRVGPLIIPYISNNIGINFHIALHLRQAAPHLCRLPFVFEVGIVDVNKLPVFVRVAQSVFIFSYIHLFCIKPRQELIPDGMHKGVRVGISQVKKLLRVFLTGKVWTILRESQGMGRCVYFGRNSDGILSRNILQLAYILPGIGAIPGGQSPEAITIETESRVLVHPIWTIARSDFIIVEVQVKIIHFIPGHHLDVVLKGTYGEKLASNIEREAALSIFWIIYGNASGDMQSTRVLEQKLQSGSRTIEDPGAGIRSDSQDIPSIKMISFAADKRICNF